MSGQTKKYRVTLPIRLEDDILHLAGAVVELDEKTALDYRHALIAVPEEGEN